MPLPGALRVRRNPNCSSAQLKQASSSVGNTQEMAGRRTRPVFQDQGHLASIRRRWPGSRSEGLGRGAALEDIRPEAGTMTQQGDKYLLGCSGAICYHVSHPPPSPCHLQLESPPLSGSTCDPEKIEANSSSRPDTGLPVSVLRLPVTIYHPMQDVSAPSFHFHYLLIYSPVLRTGL